MCVCVLICAQLLLAAVATRPGRGIHSPCKTYPCCCFSHLVLCCREKKIFSPHPTLPPFSHVDVRFPEVLLECMHNSTDDYRSRSRFLEDLPTRDIDHLPCTVYVLVAGWINCPKQKTIKFFTYA